VSFLKNNLLKNQLSQKETKMSSYNKIIQKVKK